MKVLAIALAGITAAAALYFLVFKSQGQPEPYPETIASSKELLPTLQPRAEIRSTTEIAGQAIAGSTGLAGLLDRGLEIESNGLASPKARSLRVSLASGTSWSSFRFAEIGNLQFIGVGNRWYPLRDAGLTEAIVPSGSPEAFLRLWRALPLDAEPRSAWRDGDRDHYRIGLEPQAAKRLARVWSSGRALVDLAPLVGRDLELVFDRNTQALVEVVVRGRISSNRLAELLGLASRDALGGLRSIDLRLSFGATGWGRVASLRAPGVTGTQAEGAEALSRQILPLWAGLAEG
jgi:hypothetical protein